MSASLPLWIDEFDLGHAGPPDFYSDPAQIDNQAPLQQAHILRQAWFQLGLSGILCSDGKPVAYVADVNDGDVLRMRELQQAVWSHGVAPLLLAVSPTQVYVFSSLALPTNDVALATQGGRLVEQLDRISQALEMRQMVKALQLGTYFDAPVRTYESRKSFDPKHRVDRYLLNNLNVARKQLESVSVDFDRKAVHRLLARVIFVCYLIDRRIIGQSYFAQLGTNEERTLNDLLAKDDLVAKALLFGLFKLLQIDFNGDLLEGDLQEEETRIRPEHIHVLRALLRGDDLDKGQASLAFWAYDFSIIPVETISAIYESFLEADDPDAKKEIGAYYTPRFLCEIVLDEAVAGFRTLLGKRYLDPACGSGVFLVGLFNRLAEEWRRSNPSADNIVKFANLKRIVRENIFGIDVSETACRIAAFGLYLAMLDQLDPKDIQQLATPRLPNLVLLPNVGDVETEGLNILCANFFEADLPVKFQNFDVIVGNPPWARQSKGLMRQWASSQAIAIPQGQLAAAFAIKSPRHISDAGRICLLLPAGLLFNHHSQSGRFQTRWLLECTIQRVVNLADMCFYLFENAIRPAICVTFQRGAPTSNHEVEYLVPKSDPETLRAELLSISFLDVNRISVGSVLKAARGGRPHLEWKRHLWASPRDRELLDRLDEFPKLENTLHPRESGGLEWEIGEGFQPLGPNDDPAKSKLSPMTREDRFVAGRGEHLKLILYGEDCTTAEAYAGRGLRRMPEKTSIFKAPHVVVSKGLRSGYCDFDVYFRHALRGIHGPREDSPKLMFLAGLLDSDVIRYYHFHTSANWAVERDEVHLEELLQTPFPIPGNCDEVSDEVFAEITAIMLSASGESQVIGRAQLINSYRQRLQPLFYRYFGLNIDEQVLIEDTIRIWEPSSTPGRNSKIPALYSPNQATRLSYARKLLASCNHSAVGSSWSLDGSLIWARNANLAVIQLDKVRQIGAQPQFVERESWVDLDKALKRAAAALTDVHGSVSRVRDLKLFDNDKIYLFKPLQQRFWAESVALSDSDEIVGAVLAQRAVREE